MHRVPVSSERSASNTGFVDAAARVNVEFTRRRKAMYSLETAVVDVLG